MQGVLQMWSRALDFSPESSQSHHGLLLYFAFSEKESTQYVYIIKGIIALTFREGGDLSEFWKKV